MSALFQNIVNSSRYALYCLILFYSSHILAGETTTYYYHDALGSPVAAIISDGTTDQVWREQYTPYGDRWIKDAAASGNERWYTNHLHDDDLGLTYMGARYYDPVIGRFMGIDPQGVKEGAPRTFNRYAYANNNPYKFVDPDGEFSLLIHANTRGMSLRGATEVSSYGNRSLQAGGAIAAGGAALATGEGLGALATSSVIRFSGGLLGRGITAGLGREIGILRSAANGKGNFGLGSATRAEAGKLGRAWVGDGYKVASDSKTLISKDGLRQYRPPSYKPKLDKTQANFEQKFQGQQSKRWQSNGHLDITN